MTPGTPQNKLLLSILNVLEWVEAVQYLLAGIGFVLLGFAVRYHFPPVDASVRPASALARQNAVEVMTIMFLVLGAINLIIGAWAVFEAHSSHRA